MSPTIPVHTLSKNNDSPYTARKLKPFKGAEEIEEAHRHTYYEILVFVEGVGSQMIDFETHTVQTASVYFISPGQVHALSRVKDAEGYVINFTKEFMLLNGGNLAVLNSFPSFGQFNKPVPEIPAPDFQDILCIVKQMVSDRLGNSPVKESLLTAYINLLLIKCRSILTNLPGYARSDDPGQQMAQRFSSLLEESFITSHNLKFYADKLNLSPNYLSATLKKITGKTAGDLIQQRLLLEAKRMLLHSAITIKEIAYQLNFNDPPYFTRFFKNNTGYSPEMFRQETRKKYNC